MVAWVDLAAPMPAEQFGALVGVSRQVVVDLVGRGVLARGAPARDWFLAYASHLREHAAGRVETGPLSLERQRLTRAKAARAELELRELAGELVRVADVERTQFGVWRSVRDATLAVADRLGPVLAGESDAGACTAMLADELRTTLRGAADAIGAGGRAWVEPLTRALDREIEAWARAARPDVSEDVAELRARLAGLCQAFAADQLTTDDQPCDTVTA